MVLSQKAAVIAHDALHMTFWRTENEPQLYHQNLTFAMYIDKDKVKLHLKISQTLCHFTCQVLLLQLKILCNNFEWTRVFSVCLILQHGCQAHVMGGKRGKKGVGLGVCVGVRW